MLPQRYPVEHLAEALAEGIVVGHPLMPEVSFDPPEIDALLTYVESLSPSGSAPRRPCKPLLCTPGLEGWARLAGAHGKAYSRVLSGEAWMIRIVTSGTNTAMAATVISSQPKAL